MVLNPKLISCTAALVAAYTGSLSGQARIGEATLTLGAHKAQVLAELRRYYVVDSVPAPAFDRWYAHAGDGPTALLGTVTFVAGALDEVLRSLRPKTNAAGSLGRLFTDVLMRLSESSEPCRVLTHTERAPVAIRTATITCGQHAAVVRHMITSDGESASIDELWRTRW